ncbi:MAG: DUF4124 domain-containing protein [Gemmatimonadota bacterium]
MRTARLVLLLAALAGVVVFVAPFDGGRPFLDFAEVKGRVLGGAPRIRAAEGEERGAYKWQDENGTWHFSNVRPEGVRDVQKVKEAVTWATGSGASEAEAVNENDPERPRTPAELLAESKRLEGQAGARESEMDKLMREAKE